MLDKLFHNSFHRFAYSCDQIHDFIYDYLENTLPPLTSLRFHIHLNACRECQEFLYLYEKTSKIGKGKHEINATQNQIHPPKEMLRATLDFLEKEGIVDPEKKTHE